MTNAHVNINFFQLFFTLAALIRSGRPYFKIQ